MRSLSISVAVRRFRADSANSRKKSSVRCEILSFTDGPSWSRLDTLRSRPPSGHRAEPRHTLAGSDEPEGSDQMVDQPEDLMPLQGIDHVEYYVGNARQAAYYYSKAFGFTVTAYSGPETKVRDRASWVCEQGEARLVFTGGMGPESPIVQHVALHGDGVRDVALRVPDATHAYEEALRRGATGALEPTVLEDDHGKVVKASIKAYGDTLHSFIERENYSGVFLPGCRP